MYIHENTYTVIYNRKTHKYYCKALLCKLLDLAAFNNYKVSNRSSLTHLLRIYLIYRLLSYRILCSTCLLGYLRFKQITKTQKIGKVMLIVLLTDFIYHCLLGY